MADIIRIADGSVKDISKPNQDLVLLAEDFLNRCNNNEIQDTLIVSILRDGTYLTASFISEDADIFKLIGALQTNVTKLSLNIE